ncbi:1-acyl-sn-glycerol-3-phosphate acyltransferase [Corallococcus praedator]|uniref:1-acyl-sn-glycerol-3-phosphate acyltransferase n=1 Tax=Corallococcus praedator TaxID=2316724 RepID=A0ABX9QHA8_9BACT|nr:MULTISPECIES: lysophospholipid acyltransferase family protein [Corallococcus]RKH27631.1 1-acyl-sn-glycerol-3-phosphate acyltransferase [Corallococcus sp. CA031C]RKI07173.1 1-acyl-sn-glycerol-3-phosphate acyltransferase [Corallococcus praedator]
MRKLWCMLVAAVWTAIMFFVSITAMILTLNPSRSVWVARRLWSPVLLWAGGARLEVIGAENVDPKRPTIYVGNHQSTLDIPAHFISVPVDFRYVAKSQLRLVPFIGWYLWLAGHIFINRGDRSSAIESLERAARKVREGTSIFLYPEGTRSHDGTVLPFKKGPFALALKARVPICPVTIEGSASLMPKNSWNITPGPVRVKIGRPIDTTGFAENDREGLARAVREQIIADNLSLGGKGGDTEAAIALQGKEGIAQQRASSPTSKAS